ncbi:hypothetical protein N9948_00620 [bacterium]|nr:hypothetical protein [bacterium]
MRDDTILKRDRGAMLSPRQKKYPPVLTIEEYENSPHVTRHNTICYNIDEVYAKEIFDLEQKELDPTVHDISGGWRRQESVKKINDTEYLFPYLKDPDERVGLQILKKLGTVKENIELYNKIAKDDSIYPIKLRKYCRKKLRKIDESVRFILEE